jgi:rhodanese-related sulfurtransferase
MARSNYIDLPCGSEATARLRVTGENPECGFPQNPVETRARTHDILASGWPMNTINREELRQKIDRRDQFTLINCLDEWMFREKRIPGSIRFEKAFFQTLNPKGELIVYCSNPGCTNSVMVYHQFVEHGFQNVWHYPGGIADWEDGGYQFEGEGVQRKQSSA